MWRKEEASSPVSPETNPAGAAKAAPNPPSTAQGGQKGTASVSQGIRIKGEVTGTEDLFVDGTIEGRITLGNSGLTVGPNGSVRAEISAREIVVRGLAEGKLTADERIQILQTARVHGDLKSERIVIEDGAVLQGKVEAGQAVSRPTASETGGRGKKTETHRAAEPVKNTATDAATAGAD